MNEFDRTISRDFLFVSARPLRWELMPGLATRLQCEEKLLLSMVARGGIEPPNASLFRTQLLSIFNALQESRLLLIIVTAIAG